MPLVKTQPEAILKHSKDILTLLLRLFVIAVIAMFFINIRYELLMPTEMR